MTLISRNRAKEIAEKAEKGGSGDFNPIRKGVHRATIVEVKATATKEKGEPMLEVHIQDRDLKYDPLIERHVINEGKGVEILATRLKKGFDFDFPEEDIETVEDLRKMVVKATKGREFYVVIKEKQRIYNKKDGTKMIVTDPEVYFFAPISGDVPDVSDDKLIVGLTIQQQAEWDAYRGVKSAASPAAAKTSPLKTEIQGIRGEDEEEEEEETPAPAKTAAKKAAPAKKTAAKAPTKKSVLDDDDEPEAGDDQEEAAETPAPAAKGKKHSFLDDDE